MAEPLNVLIKGIVAKWAASVTLEGVIDGPWQGERSTDDQGNPAAGTLYPYCILSGSAQLGRMSCGKEYYDHTITFRAYDKTPELAAGHAGTIKAVYDSDSLALTLDEGGVVSHRPQGSTYQGVDKKVFYAEFSYYFQTYRNRVA